MLLYGDYATWYRLVDPPADHQDEAETFRSAFAGAVSPEPQTLLELGAGAGHNEGLFSRDTWLRILGAVGYRAETIPRPVGDGAFDEIFLCRRP